MTGLWNRVAGDELLLLIANVVVQVAILTILASLVARCFRQNAAIRHHVLFSAVLGVFIIPVLTVALQASGLCVVAVTVVWHSPSVTPSPPSSPAGIATAALADYHSDETVSIADGQNGAPSIPLSLAEEPSDVAAPATTEHGHPALVVRSILAIWLLGSLWGFLGILRSGWKLRQLVLQARPLDPSRWRNVSDEVCRVLAIQALPGIACSSRVAAPTVGGIVRPLIVLPTRLVETLSRSELRDVLLHEAAHVLRRDQLVVLLQRLLGAIFWPHPLVHLLNRQLARAREEACDNYVLAGVRATDYGETLLHLAQLMPQPRLLAGSVGIFTRHWRLEHRVADLTENWPLCLRRPRRQRRGTLHDPRGSVRPPKTAGAGGLRQEDRQLGPLARRPLRPLLQQPQLSGTGPLCDERRAGRTPRIGPALSNCQRSLG